MPLYHYKIGFPGWYKQPAGKLNVIYSNHAKSEALLEKNAISLVQLPNPLDLDTFWPVEIEALGDQLQKTVYRGPLDEYRDLCLVVGNDGTVRTIWVNYHLDNHSTLRKGRYSRP